MGIFTRKLRYAAFCPPHKTEHSLSPNTPMLLFQGAVWGRQARTPEESSRLLCGEHGVSCPTGARQAFSAQNSSTKVLTVATTQNVALASWSNNYFASFWLRTASMQSTARRRSQMISISILLDLSKRGRWSARSSDLDSMLMTHMPRMCQNNNDARAPASLGALGYNTGILFHSVFPSITSQ